MRRIEADVRAGRRRTSGHRSPSVYSSEQPSAQTPGFDRVQLMHPTQSTRI